MKNIFNNKATLEYNCRDSKGHPGFSDSHNIQGTKCTVSVTKRSVFVLKSGAYWQLKTENQ